MRTVSLYLGVPAAFAMTAVSMGCNWLYLSSFGRTALVIVLLSAASIAIDVLKALAPFWLNEAWKRRHLGRGAAAVVVLVLCVGVSMASAVGFLAETHAASVGGREAVTDRYLSAKAHLEDLQTQLAPLPRPAPPGWFRRRSRPDSMIRAGRRQRAARTTRWRQAGPSVRSRNCSDWS